MRPGIDEIMAVCQCHFSMVLFLGPVFPFFPLFWVNQKGVFSTFLKMGKFYVFGHENHSQQIHKVRLSEMNQLDQLFLTFWKKMIFNVSDSTFFFKKKKNCSKVRKSEVWWHIWACHSRFSRYRVIVYQKWLKTVVFRSFFLWPLTTKLLQILIAKIRKKVSFS